ncbi:hypothetical protein D3C72_2174220 [compost metagenome]
MCLLHPEDAGMINVMAPADDSVELRQKTGVIVAKGVRFARHEYGSFVRAVDLLPRGERFEYHPGIAVRDITVDVESEGPPSRHVAWELTHPWPGRCAR